MGTNGDSTHVNVDYGYLNGCTPEKEKEAVVRFEACLKAKHDTQVVDTPHGDHRRTCLTCKYQYHYDSSG